MDYLKQCQSELNYIESKRAHEKLKQLQDHEKKRILAKMDHRQKTELMQLEQMQVTQFKEFT